jgi:hypothetical protein
MRISKELEWLQEYVDLALPHLPKRKKVVRLTQWTKVAGRYGKGCQAYCITSNHKEYRLYIKKWRFPRYDKKPSLYSKIDILELLAHELAHLIDMDHSPKHKKLEAKLISIFMTRLASTGYVSEEHEFSEELQLAS